MVNVRLHKRPVHSLGPLFKLRPTVVATKHSQIQMATVVVCLREDGLHGLQMVKPIQQPAGSSSLFLPFSLLHLHLHPAAKKRPTFWDSKHLVMSVNLWQLLFTAFPFYQHFACSKSNFNPFSSVLHSLLLKVNSPCPCLLTGYFVTCQLPASESKQSHISHVSIHTHLLQEMASNRHCLFLESLTVSIHRVQFEMSQTLCLMSQFGERKFPLAVALAVFAIIITRLLLMAALFIDRCFW